MTSVQMTSIQVTPKRIVNNKVNSPLLEFEIKNVLKEFGLLTNFTLELRGYSKSYLGRYYIKDKKIVVYVFDEHGEYIPYKEILATALHEAIHHFQYEDKGFVRVHGVMHNEAFYKMENKLLKKLDDLLS